MLSKVAASFFSSPVCFYASERLLLACVTWFVRCAACVHAHHTRVCGVCVVPYFCNTYFYLVQNEPPKYWGNCLSETRLLLD